VHRHQSQIRRIGEGRRRTRCVPLACLHINPFGLCTPSPLCTPVRRVRPSCNFNLHLRCAEVQPARVTTEQRGEMGTPLTRIFKPARSTQPCPPPFPRATSRSVAELGTMRIDEDGVPPRDFESYRGKRVAEAWGGSQIARVRLHRQNAHQQVSFGSRWTRLCQSRRGMPSARRRLVNSQSSTLNPQLSALSPQPNPQGGELPTS